MAYFVENKETEKLELHFDKVEWSSLKEDLKKHIKRFFLFSRTQGAWVSKSKGENGYYYQKKFAIENGFENKGCIGEYKSFEDQVKEKMERAEYKAERYENLSNKAEKESEQAYSKIRPILDCIPLGQPILVGHHSEKRHRRDLDKVDSAFRQSYELSEKSKYYDEKASHSSYVASGSEYKNPAYLNNRIKEIEAEIRRLKRLIGTEDGVKDPNKNWLEKLNGLLVKAEDKLSFYNKKLEEIGGVQYNKENLKDITHVKYRGTWYPLKKINQKTVSIGNWLNIPHFQWKIDFLEIQDAKTIKDANVLETI